MLDISMPDLPIGSRKSVLLRKNASNGCLPFGVEVQCLLPMFGFPRQNFWAILAKVVREANLVPETLTCVFSLSDLYTRRAMAAMSIILRNVASQRLRPAPNP